MLTPQQRARLEQLGYPPRDEIRVSLYLLPRQVSYSWPAVDGSPVSYLCNDCASYWLNFGAVLLKDNLPHNCDRCGVAPNGWCAGTNNQQD